MNKVYVWFKYVNAHYGINLPIIYDAYDRQRFLSGLGMTLWLSFTTILLSLVLGVLGAWLQGAHRASIRRGVSAYVSVFRNTPPLIQLYFFYFGVGAIMPRILGTGQHPVISAVGWAIISLGLGAGALNVEIFRSGIEAVPKTTLEAAEALGYGRFGGYRHIVLPLAFRVCLPALTNNLVNLVKTTTLAYAVGVPELLYVSAQVWSDDFNVRTMMVVLLIAYLVIIGLLVMMMNWLERFLRIPGYG